LTPLIQQEGITTLCWPNARQHHHVRACVPGDGNTDRVINQQDLDDWAVSPNSTTGRSSGTTSTWDGLDRRPLTGNY